MKKSPVEIVFEFTKAEFIAKFEVEAPNEYLTTREIVAPLSVATKVEATEDAAWVALIVTVPAVAKVNVSFGVPNVALCPLTVAEARVASVESAAETLATIL